MEDMPDPHDPRGFVVEWQLADDEHGMAHGLVDLSVEESAQSDREVVLTDDVGLTSITATGR